MVNTYAAQSGGCRFESLWGFGFSLKGAYYEVGYCGKKNFLSWTAMHIDFVMCNNRILFANLLMPALQTQTARKFISLLKNWSPRKMAFQNDYRRDHVVLKLSLLNYPSIFCRRFSREKSRL